jgi:hypothetical protein
MRARSFFAASAGGLEPKWGSGPGDIGSKCGCDRCAVLGYFQCVLKLSFVEFFASAIQSRRCSRLDLGGMYTFRWMVQTANHHHNGLVRSGLLEVQE